MKHILFTGINGPRNMATNYFSIHSKRLHIYKSCIPSLVRRDSPNTPKMVNAKIEHSINWKKNPEKTCETNNNCKLTFSSQLPKTPISFFKNVKKKNQNNKMAIKHLYNVFSTYKLCTWHCIYTTLLHGKLNTACVVFIIVSLFTKHTSYMYHSQFIITVEL